MQCKAIGKSIGEISKACWKTAEDHGFHSPMPTFGDHIALCHTELSEALEEFRKSGRTDTPEVQEEMADVCIRIFDMAGVYGWDLEKAIDEKMKKNESRPYRHGGKKL